MKRIWKRFRRKQENRRKIYNFPKKLLANLPGISYNPIFNT